MYVHMFLSDTVDESVRFSDADCSGIKYVGIVDGMAHRRESK